MALPGRDWDRAGGRKPGGQKLAAQGPWGSGYWDWGGIEPRWCQGTGEVCMADPSRVLLTAGQGVGWQGGAGGGRSQIALYFKM